MVLFISLHFHPLFKGPLNLLLGVPFLLFPFPMEIATQQVVSSFTDLCSYHLTPSLKKWLNLNKISKEIYS